MLTGYGTFFVSPKLKSISIFLIVYRSKWLNDDNTGAYVFEISTASIRRGKIYYQYNIIVNHTIYYTVIRIRTQNNINLQSRFRKKKITV